MRKKMPAGDSSQEVRIANVQPRDTTMQVLLVLHILETVTNTLHLTPQLLSRITHTHNALDQTLFQYLPLISHFIKDT
jgi:hypothetical protein